MTMSPDRDTPAELPEDATHQDLLQAAISDLDSAAIGEAQMKLICELDDLGEWNEP